MGRHKKTSSDSKSPKSAPKRRMPGTSGSGGGKETIKGKRKTVSNDAKSSGENSTGRGGGRQKNETVPASTGGLTTTSTRIITTPSRYNFPFLRSTVKKPAKVQSPPPGPSNAEKGKEKEKDKDKEKQGKTEQPKAERKRWEAWSTQDKNLFFEAVAENGKDFELVQRYIEQRHKKLGYPPNQIKNKDQVRHLYYRTCHKLLKYVTPLPDQPRINSELFALVNYGELRKKLKGGLTAKSGQKLDELVSRGVTSLRFKGRNIKVKTPVCKALKKIKNPEKDEEKPVKLPARVLLELQPRSNAAWAEVQGVAHNPRLRLVVPLQKDMGRLLTYLSEKWTPHRVRLLHSLKPADKSNFNQVQLHVPKGVTVTPYNKLQGRFIHTSSKTPFTLVAADDSPTDTAGAPPSNGQVNGDAFKDEKGSAQSDLAASLLNPNIDSNMQQMEVDLLGNDHASDVIMADTSSLPSMFGDGQSIGDLLSTMGSGATSNSLTFGELSLSLSGSGHPSSLNALTQPSSHTLLQCEPMDVDHRTTSPSTGRGAGDGAHNSNATSSPQAQKSPSCDGEENDVKMDVVKVEEEEEKKDIPKDELLKEGLTAVTAAGMTATDVYLMMGRPETLKFEYDFVKKEALVRDTSHNHMMKKLVHLAKSSYSDVSNPKQFVSVGVVTSPLRTNTPPSKSQQADGAERSPSTNGRSPRGAGSRGNARGGGTGGGGASTGSTSSKGQRSVVAGKSDSGANQGKEDGASVEEEDAVQFRVPKSVAPIAIRRSQEPSHTQEGQQMLNQMELMKRPPANFLLPRMKKRQRGVKPLVVQRTILPRPHPHDGLVAAATGDKMVSMAIINSSSRANMGQFMPIQVSMASLGNVAARGMVPAPSPPPNTTGPTLPRPIRPSISTLPLSPASPAASPAAMTTATVAGMGKTPSKMVLAPTQVSSKTVVRRIIPVNVSDSPESGGNLQGQSAVPRAFSPAPSPLMPSSPSPESQVNQVSTSQLAASPSPSPSPSTTTTSSPQPLGSSTPARGSPHPMVIPDSSSLTNTVPPTTGVDRTPTTPPRQPIRIDSSVLNTPVVVEKDQAMEGIGSSLLEEPSLDATAISVSDSSLLNNTLVAQCRAEPASSTISTPTTTLSISPPEMAALLDISMTPSENGDGISSIILDSSTFKTFGRNISSTSPNSSSSELLNTSTLSRDIGNVSPTSSPFKINSLGPEAQWFNGESLDISMSSLLGHLESPEKKDKTSLSVATSASAAPSLSLPPGLLSESSRDSIITRDVDSTLQVMLNENSIDYVAKFADLAAHISATPDTPHKANLIDKALEAEERFAEEGAPALGIPPPTLESPSLVDA